VSPPSTRIRNSCWSVNEPDGAVHVRCVTPSSPNESHVPGTGCQPNVVPSNAVNTPVGCISKSPSLDGRAMTRYQTSAPVLSKIVSYFVLSAVSSVAM